MKQAFFFLLFSGILMGCAASPQQGDNSAQIETQRMPDISGEVYLAILRSKKNRFLEQYNGAIKADNADGLNSKPVMAMTEIPESECTVLGNSQWASSVLYGQSFIVYENFLKTMSRCYSE